MYQQSNTSYDSVGRRSSYNPFRQSYMPTGAPQTQSTGKSTSAAMSSNSAFDDWVQRNKKLINESSDEDDGALFERPSFPTSSRTGSDTNVNYNNRRMSSNNPFALDMNDDYKHYRDPPPPPPPGGSGHRARSGTRGSSPYSKSTPPPPPPAYEEAAGSRALSRDYPEEKPQQHTSSSRSSRPHRSHSDSSRQKDRRPHRKTKESSKKKSVAPHKPKNLDTIDKLDVSAFFGGRFHHDGPFDACTPHRNKNVKAAPFKAFSVDGPNTSMKANAPTDDRLDLVFGNYEDQNMIIGSSAKEHPVASSSYRGPTVDQLDDVPRLNPSVVAFDAYEKAPPIHGYSTAGLGSTTFLNGAPAPKAEESLAVPNGAKNGLGRKKSLVQRLRKNGGSESSSRRTSNENSSEYYRYADEDEDGPSLIRRVRSLKVGKK